MDAPSTLGSCVDKLWELQSDIQKTEAQLKASPISVRLERLQKEYDELQEHIFQRFGDAEVDGATGRKAAAVVVAKDYPTIKDWDAFIKYVRRRNAWDLIQRRPATMAARARWQDGLKIPGLERYTKKTVSLKQRS